MARRNGMTVKTKGTADIMRALTDLKSDLGGPALVAGVTAAAEAALPIARANAPKDTGEGAESLMYVVQAKPGEAVAKLGPDREHYYMGIQEVGYPVEKKDGSIVNVPPKHFMSNAIRMPQVQRALAKGAKEYAEGAGK